MNIQSAITQGAEILKNKFFLNPYLDSEILMSKVIKKDKKYLKPRICAIGLFCFLNFK